MNIRYSITIIVLLFSLSVIAADTTQYQGLLLYLKKHKEMKCKEVWVNIHNTKTFTSWIDKDGNIMFGRDVYRKD